MYRRDEPMPAPPERPPYVRIALANVPRPGESRTLTFRLLPATRRGRILRDCQRLERASMEAVAKYRALMVELEQLRATLADGEASEDDRTQAADRIDAIAEELEQVADQATEASTLTAAARGWLILRCWADPEWVLQAREDFEAMAFRTVENGDIPAAAGAACFEELDADDWPVGVIGQVYDYLVQAHNQAHALPEDIQVRADFFGGPSTPAAAGTA